VRDVELGNGEFPRDSLIEYRARDRIRHFLPWTIKSNIVRRSADAHHRLHRGFEPAVATIAMK
jgi:hypothetical protein